MLHKRDNKEKKTKKKKKNKTKPELQQTMQASRTHITEAEEAIFREGKFGVKKIKSCEVNFFFCFLPYDPCQFRK